MYIAKYQILLTKRAPRLVIYKSYFMRATDIKQIVEFLLKNRKETLSYYFEDGNFPEERLSLHKQIIRQILDKKDYSKSNQVFMLGGAPANGKSSFLESLFCPYPATALKIDPDEIKEKLPEYTFMLNNKEPLAAAIVHEESSLISKKLKSAAMAKGIDLILDGVADDTIQKRKEVFDELKEHNYYVRVDYVSLDSTLSLQIARKRAEETGREVPESYVKTMNRAIAQLVPEIIENEYFDEFYLWDTNDHLKPVLILKQENGKLQLENPQLLGSFIKKGL